MQADALLLCSFFLMKKKLAEKYFYFIFRIEEQSLSILSI